MRGGEREILIDVARVESQIIEIPAENRTLAQYVPGEGIGFLEHKRASNSIADAMLVWIALPSDAFWVRHRLGGGWVDLGERGDLLSHCSKERRVKVAQGNPVGGCN